MSDYFTPIIIAERMGVTEQELEALILTLPLDHRPLNVGTDEHPRWRWKPADVEPWIDRVHRWQTTARSAAPEDRRAITDWRKELLGDDS